MSCRGMAAINTASTSTTHEARLIGAAVHLERCTPPLEAMAIMLDRLAFGGCEEFEEASDGSNTRCFARRPFA